MTLRSHQSILLVAAWFLLSGAVQAQDPGSEDQIQRDITSATIDGSHSRFSLWRSTAFDWRTNPTGGGIAHVADDVLAKWRQSWGNLVKIGRKAMDRRYIANIGKANFFADSGSTIMGHLVEGNIEGAFVAGTNELVEAGAAYLGAKAFGGLGATYGFAVAGPPGMMVGGLIGAAGGAAAAVWGYNVTLSGTVTGTVEAWQEKDREYYLNLARESRREFLARPENRDLERKYFIDQARENREEFLVLQATKRLEEKLARDPLALRPRDREDADFLMRHAPGGSPTATGARDIPKLSAPEANAPDRWKDLESRAKRVAKETTENPKPEQAEDPETIPVIPDVAVIDAVFRVPQTNEVIRWSFSKRGNEVSGQSSYEFPGTSGPNFENGNLKATLQFDGTAVENAFRGRITEAWTPWETRSWSPDGKFKQRQRVTYAVERYDCELNFQIDGTVQIRSGKSTARTHVQIIEGLGEDYDGSHDREAWTANGVWQYRQAPADAQLRRAPEDSK